jgi:serine/threonine protein phosphatase PrpC
VAAVADGHGSRKSFRSDRGSKFATASAVRALGRLVVEYAARLQDATPAARTAAASELCGLVQTELPQWIVGYWRQAVEDELVRKPFADTELKALSTADREAVASNGYAAYGTTLVAALLMPSHAVYLQLGDGDILVVEEDGGEPSRPLPPDERSFANETASMSAIGGAPSSRRPGGEPPGPWADFRVRVVQIAPDPPALALLTTDGYPNAFAADAGFRKAATDLFAIGRQQGWEFVRRELRGWLDEASRHGSGDDVTVAVLIREAGPEPDTARPPSNSSDAPAEASLSPPPRPTRRCHD